MPGGRDQSWSTIIWNRTWMNPLAPVCSIHGPWLTPVAIRTLAAFRHAADFGGIVQQVAAAQAQLAQWLQSRCTARTAVCVPWRWTRLRSPADHQTSAQCAEHSQLPVRRMSTPPAGMLRRSLLKMPHAAHLVKDGLWCVVVKHHVRPSGSASPGPPVPWHVPSPGAAARATAAVAARR